MKNDMQTPLKSTYKQTRCFPAEVYNKIPPELRILTISNTGQLRQQDMFLMALITLLSGCYPKVYGRYFGKKVHSNLYTIVGAPPASGKSGILLSKLIGDKVQEKLTEQYKKDFDEFREKHAEWKVNPIGPEPMEPIRKLYFIPGNNSSAGIVLLLSDNDGCGFILESELDSMEYALDQKFGNYSDILRKGFHHEPISSFRKTNSVFKLIEFPCISMLLSGTPEQLTKLIKSGENGLFSRIIFYVYDDKPKFTNPFAAEHTNTQSLFEQFADKVSTAYFASLDRAEIEFSFTETQIIRFNEKFPEVVDDYYNNVGNVGVSIPMRMGLIFFRIAMIFSALRGDKMEKIFCCDDDFDAAEAIVDVLLGHSLAVFSSLPTSEENTGELMNDEELLAKLPQEFESKAIVIAMQKKGYSKRSAFRTLRQLCDKKLIRKHKLGCYKKCTNSDEG